ncbi:hypothetical protein RA27_22130 [Ruegeria sp. ANG-R]|nr:hypothetical protein RA27_22130 [Ruegeria sp. ANG-R]
MNRQDLSERRASDLPDRYPSAFQYKKQDQSVDALRNRLRELTNERCWVEYRRLGALPAGDRFVVTHS